MSTQINIDEPSIKEIVAAELHVYTYAIHPMVFMFAMGNEMFVESYHLAGRGGEAPILQVSQYKNQASQEKKMKANSTKSIWVILKRSALHVQQS